MTILVNSTGIVTDINGRNNVSNIKFQNGNIIKLQSQKNSKVIITNFPNTSTPVYIPKKMNKTLSLLKMG